MSTGADAGQDGGIAETGSDDAARAGRAASRIRRGGRVSGGLRLAISTLTIWRAGVPRADAAAVRVAMTAAPVVGLGVGAVAAGSAQLALWLTGSPLIAAVIAVAALAAQTRALHLDGLADTADGLGSNKPAEQALALMKNSDIGPFGVVTLVLVLGVQISALAASFAIHRGPVAVIVAAMAGRLAITAGCTEPIPSARPGGLGSWVAGSVRVRTAVIAGIVVAIGSGALGLIVDPQTAALAAAAVPLGLAAALALLARSIDRLGGITGDVLGALVETSAAVATLVVAVRF
ncbi:MAG TPA: adenosylcobinamide-GDP ribazoletransferase [Actinocrinis sp.]|nr:adenosylcobinamide-GDP ribazoletransferase [Actinocrinis sp.]